MFVHASTNLEAIADVGITDVGLVIGDTAPAIEEAVGDGSVFGIRASYIRQEAPLGLAHAVLMARDFLGDDDFVMYLGDNFIVGGITQLTEEFRAVRPDAQIMLTRVPDPRNFGVAELDARGQVIRLEEKPRQPTSDLVLVGVYMFTPAIHDAVRDLKPSWRGELEITEAIQWLIDHGKTVHSSVITGFWKDTGNVADMLEVNRLVLEGLDPRHDGTTGTECEIIGKVAIEAGAHVSGSRIVGPVVIGAGARVIDSYIGPFSAIGADCVIEDTEIEDSIVLRGASIRGVRRIGASLIGRHAQVMPAPRVPQVHRLVLGDHSVVADQLVTARSRFRASCCYQRLCRFVPNCAEGGGLRREAAKPGMAASRPGGLLRRRLSSGRRGLNRLGGPRRAPARDHVVDVHQPHVNRRPDRDAAPLDDPPVEVAERLAHLGLRAHLPHGLGQLLDFPAQL